MGVTLVTGSNGYLGSIIKSKLSHYIEATKSELDINDSRKMERVIKKYKPTVIHAAVSRTKELFKTNYLSTMKLADLCMKYKCNFTYISSIKTNFDTLCYYGYTKYLAEHYIAEYTPFPIVKLPTILKSERIFIDHWIEDAIQKKCIEVYYHNGESKKTIVVEPEIAADACIRAIQPYTIGLDYKIIADCIGKNFNVPVKVNNRAFKKEMEVENILDHKETHQLLRKYFNLS